VTRILAALFSLLLIGAAAAQPPVDYILLCDGVVIGTASYVGGGFDVAVLVDARDVTLDRGAARSGERRRAICGCSEDDRQRGCAVIAQRFGEGTVDAPERRRPRWSGVASYLHAVWDDFRAWWS
jgi:hypothetical protein